MFNQHFTSVKNNSRSSLVPSSSPSKENEFASEIRERVEWKKSPGWLGSCVLILKLTRRFSPQHHVTVAPRVPTFLRARVCQNAHVTSIYTDSGIHTNRERIPIYLLIESCISKKQDIRMWIRAIDETRSLIRVI